jgi:NitT/TauT family transport system permease protein
MGAWIISGKNELKSPAFISLVFLRGKSGWFPTSRALRWFINRKLTEHYSLKLLRYWLQGLPAYLWSGWGAISSLLLFMAVWEWGNQVYGDLVLPTPLAAFSTLGQLFASGEAWTELLITGWRAFAGFLLSVAVGSVLGIVAGLSMTASMMSRPIVTVLVGMPPIAWIVLALLWFGATDIYRIYHLFPDCLCRCYARCENA